MSLDGKVALITSGGAGIVDVAGAALTNAGVKWGV